MKLEDLYAHIYIFVLARAHTYFYIKLSCMHDAVTCNIVANYSTVQN